MCRLASTCAAPCGLVTRRTLVGPCLFPWERHRRRLVDSHETCPRARMVPDPSCVVTSSSPTAETGPFRPGHTCPFRTNSSPALCHPPTRAGAHWWSYGAVGSPDPTDRLPGPEVAPMTEFVDQIRQRVSDALGDLAD